MIYPGSSLKVIQSIAPKTHQEFLDKIKFYVESGADLEDVTSLYSLIQISETSSNIIEVVNRFKQEYSNNWEIKNEIVREKIKQIIN